MVEPRLTEAVEELDKTLREFPRRYKFVFSPLKSLWLAFLKGIAYGLGIIVAVVLVIPIIIGLMKSVEWVPLIGEFLTDVIIRMEEINQIK